MYQIYSLLSDTIHVSSSRSCMCACARAQVSIVCVYVRLLCVQEILAISWNDRMANIEVFQPSKTSGLESLAMKAQLRRDGHVVRIVNSRILKLILLSEMASSTRNTGGQIRRYNEYLKASLRACGITIFGWDTTAADCHSGRLAVHNVTHAFEETCLQELTQKRQIRKQRSQACPKCGRIYASDFVLRSHLRPH